MGNGSTKDYGRGTGEETRVTTGERGESDREGTTEATGVEETDKGPESSETGTGSLSEGTQCRSDVGLILEGPSRNL